MNLSNYVEPFVQPYVQPFVAGRAGLSIAITTGESYHPDAVSYFERGEAAGGGVLLPAVRTAFSNFFALAATDPAPIAATRREALAAGQVIFMMGWANLAGAFTPAFATGPTVTNNNFVQGDYDPKQGLKPLTGNEYLNLGIDNAAGSIPQNDRALIAWRTESETRTTNRAAIGMGNSGVGLSMLLSLTNSRFFRLSYNNTSENVPDVTSASGLLAASRQVANQVGWRYGGTSGVLSSNSATPSAGNVLGFCRGEPGAPTAITDARQCVLGFTRALDLTLEEARLASLITAIQAALP